MPLLLLQARQTSSRLPNKSLALLAGIPSVVLAARRAMNTGLSLIVVVPDSAQNEELRLTLSRNQIAYHAGPEEDVLRRFCGAVRNLSMDRTVIRLTADNIFPDGQFLQLLIAEYESAKTEYLGIDIERSNTPYGLNAEMFKVSAIREADSCTTSSYDREHVTPWIKRNKRTHYFVLTDINRRAKRYRATIDTQADLDLISEVMLDVNHPTSVHYSELANKLVSVAERTGVVPGRIVSGRWISNTALGTAQMGFIYGVANEIGVPTLSDCAAMISRSISKGVSLIDTAQAYGTSEETIGLTLGSRPDRPIIASKLRPRTLDPVEGINNESTRLEIERSVRETNSKLGGIVDFFLLHKWRDIYAQNGEILRTLKHHKDSGQIKSLGASVLNVEEFQEALAHPDIEMIQFPYNILDHRWEDSLKIAVGRHKIFVARSTLLQGLLLQSVEKWPSWATESGLICTVLDNLFLEFGLESRLDLCLAYVRSNAAVTSLVFGAEHPAQVAETIRLQTKEPLSPLQIAQCKTALAGLASDRLLDPWRWHG